MTGNDSARTDSQLVDELRTGSREAFAQLYKRYSNGIYSYCARLLANSAAAEDTAHDTFVKSFEQISSLQHPELLRAWIFKIARNEALTLLSRQRSNGLSNADSIWDDETPLEQLVSKETTEIVQQLLKNLKREYREVIILREYEQLTYAEIADVTGATESSVKSRIFKARKALAEKLKPYFE